MNPLHSPFMVSQSKSPLGALCYLSVHHTTIQCKSLYFRHLVSLVKSYRELYQNEKNVSVTWQTRVMYLGPSPLNSLQNSDRFTCKTLRCSSVWSKVTENCTEMIKTCQTREGHVSRAWDHHHWTPCKILTCLHVRHLDVAHLEQKLKILKKYRTVLYRLVQCTH